VVTDKHKSPICFERFELIDGDILKSITANRPYLNEIYSSSRLILNEPKFILVPAALHMNPDDLETTFSLNFDLKEDETLVEEDLDDEKRLAFSALSEVYMPLSIKFPGIRVHHCIFYLLKTLHEMASREDETIGIARQGEYITVLAMRGNALLLANSFVAKSNEEVVYFSMLAIEQLGLNHKGLSLHLLGKWNNQELIDWFRDYITFVGEVVPKEIDVSNLSSIEQEQFYADYTLQAALLCE
jgi:hypothetical protein